MALSQEFEMTRADADVLRTTMVQTVTKVVHTAWREQAKKNLHSTREQYMNSIVTYPAGRFENVVALVGKLPNMIEYGTSAFDMKEGFAKSTKKTITKNEEGDVGWYLTIPFSYSQPTSLGESSTFSGVLPSDVAGALKSKQKEVGQDATLNLKDIPTEFQIPKARAAITMGSGVMMPEYTHKNSIYEGLQQKTKGGAVMSFRRVSNNSDFNSWIHTGILEKNFAEKAVQDSKIPDVASDVIDKFLDQLIG